RLDRAWTVLAGGREDVTLADLAKLRKDAGITKLSIPASAEALKAAIGDRWKRKVRIHYMPQGTAELPTIATFLGPRIVAGSGMFGAVVEPSVADRHAVHVADAAYALGSDRAKIYLADDLKKFPDLASKLP